jgi:hypothetical protein
MGRDDVLKVLARDGGVPGESCRGIDFGRAAGLDFRECCGSDSPGYHCREFVARSPGGGLLCIGLNRDTGRINCGSMGYHFVHGGDPCV